MVQFSQCLDCMNFIENDNGIFKCQAFPKGIPYDVFWNERIHDVYIEGDHGKIFVPIDQKKDVDYESNI